MYSLRKSYNRNYYLALVRIAIRKQYKFARLRLAAWFLKMSVKTDSEILKRYEKNRLEGHIKAFCESYGIPYWEEDDVRS